MMVNKLTVKLAQKKINAEKLTDALKCLEMEIGEITDKLKELKLKEKEALKATPKK